MCIEDKQTITTLFVTKADAARYLNVSFMTLIKVMQRYGIADAVGGRIDLVEFWRKIFGIYDVPYSQKSAMLRPLLSINDVANGVGVDDTTIRRAITSRSVKWNLPDAINLGSRVTRFLPVQIEFWLKRQEPPIWLHRRYGPVGSIGLRLNDQHINNDIREDIEA